MRAGRITAVRQQGEGSFHLAKDKATVEHLLPRGWDTPVADLIGKLSPDVITGPVSE